MKLNFEQVETGWNVKDTLGATIAVIHGTYGSYTIHPYSNITKIYATTYTGIEAMAVVEHEIAAILAL